MWGNLLIQLAPVLFGTLSPVLTASVKKGADALGAKIPDSAKPIVNGLFGIVLAALSSYLTGYDVGTVAPAGVFGAMLGAKVRDTAVGGTK